MPAPTNISFATATDLGTISTTPTVVTQQVDDAGTTYTVYFKITAPSNAVVIGAHGFGDLAVYKPTIQPYHDDQTGILSISLINGLIQFPTFSTDSFYYIRLSPNAGNPTPANLTLTIQVAPSNPASVGDFITNDDQAGFNIAGVVSRTANYEVKRFIAGLPAGESGDILDNGILCLEDGDTGEAKLFDSADEYSLVATIALSNGIVSEPGAIRAHNLTNKFYVGNSSTPGKFCTVTDAGVASSLITLTGGTALSTLAASNDETILYFAGGAAPQAVQRWNIIGSVLLTDLVAGIGSDRIGDIIVLSDDTILVGYFGADYNVIRYSAAGAVLNTYPFGVYSISAPRMCTTPDSPPSFGVMINDNPSNSGTKRFIITRISDGVILSTRTGAVFAAGEYTGAVSATPPAAFGTSPSCPAWMLRVGSFPATSGLYTVSGTGAIEAAKVAAGQGTGVALIRHDQNWIDVIVGTSENVKIPDPYYDTFLAGDE